MIRQFGIIYLDDKRTDIDAKGNHLKKFKSFYNTSEDYVIKTKRKEMHRTFCIINTNDFSVNEYIIQDNIDEKLFGKIMTCNWSLKINKLEIDNEIDYNKSNRINYEGDIISVDPDGCIDIDDAINYKINDNSIEIGIHIADPSSYIDINSDIGKELLKRCESVYLDETHHMIPQHFGIKYISLRENQIKRAYSLIINFNTNNIEEINKCLITKNYIYKFVKTNIKINKNLSYDDFEKQICNNSNEYYTNIYNIGKQIINGLNLDNNMYDSHKMVEAYMILCNHLAANHTQIKRANNKKYKNPAKYTTEDIIHERLGLKYTHFTSPMRRIVDFINHIIIYSNYNSNCKLINFNNFNLDYINSIHKYYKKIYNIRNIHKLLGDNQMLKINGIIVMIDDNKITVDINNQLIYIKIFDKKLLLNNIIKLIEQNDEYIIFKYKEQEIKYELNQNINITIYRQKLEINLFKIIINDVYPFLCI